MKELREAISRCIGCGVPRICQDGARITPRCRRLRATVIYTCVYMYIYMTKKSLRERERERESERERGVEGEGRLQQLEQLSPCKNDFGEEEGTENVSNKSEYWE